MPEKSSKKTVQLRVTRRPGALPRTIVATAFRIRKSSNPASFIDLLLEGGTGVKNERVIFDPTVLRSNIKMLKQYAAKIVYEAADDVQKDEIPISEGCSGFANIAHFSQMGEIAGTNFSVFSLSDWVEATRQQVEKTVEIQSVDALRVISTTAFQKKLLNELILMIGGEA